MSFAGYVGIRLLEPGAGVLVTGLCGGLVASTATTLTLIRRANDLDRALHGAVAAGIVAACTTMIARVVILATIVHPPLLRSLIVPFGAALVASAGMTAWLWWSSRARTAIAPAAPAPRNPLDLRVALGFGLLLAVIMMLTEAARSALGPLGLYLLSALSGLADVDAITVSMAQQVEKQLPHDVAVMSLAIAAAVNTLVKAALAGSLAPPTVARRVAVALSVVLAAGAVALTAELL